MAALVFSAILCAGIFSVLYNPAWHVGEIRISGFETLVESELRETTAAMLDGRYAGIIPRRSYFVARSSAIEEKLLQTFPQIKSALVEKKFPDALNIAVEERKIWGIACNGLLKPEEPDCVYVDTTGFGTGDSPSSSGSLILKIKTDIDDLRPGTQIFDRVVVEKILVLEKEVERILGSEIVGYEIPTKISGEVRVDVADGFRLLFVLDDTLDHQFGVLKTVLEKEIQNKRSQLSYIDLRFGNKVFYKWK